MIIIIPTIKYASTYYNTFTMGVCSNYHGYFFGVLFITILIKLFFTNFFLPLSLSFEQTFEQIWSEPSSIRSRMGWWLGYTILIMYKRGKLPDGGKVHKGFSLLVTYAHTPPHAAYVRQCQPESTPMPPRVSRWIGTLQNATPIHRRSLLSCLIFEDSACLCIRMYLSYTYWIIQLQLCGWNIHIACACHRFCVGVPARTRLVRLLGLRYCEPSYTRITTLIVHCDDDDHGGHVVEWHTNIRSDGGDIQPSEPVE